MSKFYSLFGRVENGEQRKLIYIYLFSWVVDIVEFSQRERERWELSGIESCVGAKIKF